MTFKMNTGVLNGHPEGKMLMKVEVPAGVKMLDYGTLIFNPTDEKDRLPSVTNEVVIEGGSFDAANWLDYLVGIVADFDGLLIAEDGTCLISTIFSIEVNSMNDYLTWLKDNKPDSTALLPFKIGSATDGILVEELLKTRVTLSAKTGTIKLTNAIQ